MSPARGLWVATLRGEHAGVVERLDGAYHARDARGRVLGTFEDLDSAHRSIDGRIVDVPVVSHGFVTKLLWAVNAVAVAFALVLALVLFR